MRRPQSLGCAAVLASVLALLAGPATGREDEPVIDITGGAEGAIPIAIVPFRTAEDVSLDHQLAPIIRANLARTGRFDVLPPADMVEQPSRLAEVRFSRWQASGMDHLVIGGVTAGSKSRYEVRYELLDVYAGRRADGRRYRAEPGHLRTLGHAISDRIYAEITGRKGPFNTRIAYIAVEDADGGEGRSYRLVVADSDGRRPTTVLHSEAPLLSPAWSPDRGRLAYVSFEGNQSEIFIQEVQTGERKRIASFSGINSAPAWSPDGEQLAVTLSRDGAANIYLIDVATGETTPLTEHWAIDTGAAWAPDGETIYFTSDRGGHPQIYRTQPEPGRTVERVTYEGEYNADPRVSPNGERLAMVHRRDGDDYIAVRDVDSEGLRIISEGPSDESPSFAPGGDIVIYTAGGVADSQLQTASVLGDAVAPLQSPEGPDVRLREPAW